MDKTDTGSSGSGAARQSDNSNILLVINGLMNFGS